MTSNSSILAVIYYTLSSAFYCKFWNPKHLRPELTWCINRIPLNRSNQFKSNSATFWYLNDFFLFNFYCKCCCSSTDENERQHSLDLISQNYQFHVKMLLFSLNRINTLIWDVMFPFNVFVIWKIFPWYSCFNLHFQVARRLSWQKQKFVKEMYAKSLI